MKEFLNKRNIINILLLGIMVLAIPLTIKLVRQQQILFSRAAEAQIIFLAKDQGGPTIPNDPNSSSCVITRNNRTVSLCPSVKVRFVAPTGEHISFQGHTTLLPQEGLVSTAYAGHTCPNVTTYCDGNDIWQDTCDPYGHSVNTVCVGTCIDVNGVATCFGGNPTPTPIPPPSCNEDVTYCQNGRSIRKSGGSYDRSNASADTNGCVYNFADVGSCPSDGDGSKKGQRCEAGYNQVFEDGTTRHCAPGEYSNDEGTECAYDGNGDGAGPSDNSCTIVSCPTGQVLVGNECKGIGVTRCDGQLTSACGPSGYPNNQLNATWNLSGTAGTCNVFIRDNDSDKVINTGGACEGNWNSANSGGSFKNTDVTNDGHYQLIVSNGSANCTNQKKGDITLSCSATGEACSNTTNTLTSTCGAQAGTHTLTARWSITGTAGTCNVYIRESGTDVPVNQGGACSGERTFTGSFPNGHVITNDGHYQLFVSNGSTCSNVLARDLTLNCSGGSTTAEKCFACENNRYRYAGADGALSSCPATAAICNPANADTCKSTTDLRTQVCNTAAAPEITKFRFAENPSELAGAEVNSYQQGGVIVPHTFSDTLGEKSIWYQFGDDAGNWTEQRRGGILLVGPDTVITGSSCNINLDIKDGSLLFRVQGDNFGSQNFSNSRLSADNSNLEIREWTSQRVVARMANPPDTTTGKTYAVVLTRSDGVSATATCGVDTTQISFGAKLFCRAPSSFDQDNVSLTIVQNALGVGTTASVGIGLTAPTVGFRPGSKARETVTITKEGVISNLKTKLQEGLEYILCIKAPKSLRICTNKFTAVSGNNIIPKFDLPVGDVNDDDTINSVDAGICKAEWGPAGGSRAKACEFNRDNVTNSFEWSCLLHDFGKSSQAEP